MRDGVRRPSPGGPRQLLAAHGAGEACYNCHTLDEKEADLGTSMINKQGRTFPNIKLHDGLPPAQTPENLGCTFCHNDNGHTDRMKPALTHFQGRTSFHPVGYAFEGAGEREHERRVPEHLRLRDARRTRLRRLPRP